MERRERLVLGHQRSLAKPLQLLCGLERIEILCRNVLPIITIKPNGLCMIYDVFLFCSYQRISAFRDFISQNIIVDFCLFSFSCYFVLPNSLKRQAFGQLISVRVYLLFRCINCKISNLWH